MTALVVMAKEPVAGRSKTRLCPPCSPTEAAGLAEAALHDTLVAVADTPASRRVVALDGRPGDWLPPGFEVVAQRGQGLDERLGAALVDVGGPVVLVGMDTPQVGPADLASLVDRLHRPGVDAVLGLATDGGWWTIGLHEPGAHHFSGVPMSTDHTGRDQLARLRDCGLRVDLVEERRDVDRWPDALAAAAAAPATTFAHGVRSLDLTVGARAH